MLGKNERGTGFLIPATERRLCPVFFSCARGTRKTRHPLLGRTRLASQRRGTLVQIQKGTQKRPDGALGRKWQTREFPRSAKERTLSLSARLSFFWAG
jgi:hypothetical protein